MRRVLFVVDSIYGGGAGRVVSELASSISTEYEVAVIAFFNDQVSYKLNNNVRFVTFATNNGKNTDSALQKIKKLRIFCQNFHADLVISFLTDLNIYSILAGIGQPWKTIISERSDPRYAPREKKVRIARTLFYHFADGFVFQTKEARAFFNKSIQKRSVIIANPLSKDLPPIADCFQIGKIVSVGRIVKLKNYEMAINAISSLINEYSMIKYCIYGDGPDRECIQKMINDNQLSNHVTIAGHISEVYTHMKDAQLFIITSDYEGLSNALMEAIALGIPVISTEVGGARQLIEDGTNGYIVKCKDMSSLAEAIKNCFSDTEINNRAKEYSKSFREKYSVASINHIWKEYIERVML